jgi:hypothetical protein
MELPKLIDNVEYIKLLYSPDKEEVKKIYSQEVNKLIEGLGKLIVAFDLGDSESIAKGEEYILNGLRQNYWSGNVFLVAAVSEKIKVSDDWYEGFSWFDDYANLLDMIKSKSIKNMKIDNIEYSDSESTVSFSLNDKHYTKEISLTGGSIDNDFIRYLIDLFTQSGTEVIYIHDTYVFIPKEMKEIADNYRYFSIDSGGLADDCVLSEEESKLSYTLREEYEERKAAAYWEAQKNKKK